MKELTSVEIKNEILKIMIDLDIFLRENNIKYSITSGTLLGAVRHKGFIPWDDDIDISMLRTDYNKLIKILKINNKIGKNLKGVGFELGETHLPFLKIVNTNIYSEEVVIKNIVSKGNLWVDIFPFDAVPRLLYNYNTKFLDRFVRKLYERKRVSVEFTELINNSKFDKIVSKISFDTITKYYIKRSSIFNIKHNLYIRDYTWGNTTMNKHLMDDIVDYEFEGIKLKGLKDYDTYLSNLYGDYMKLPPEEKRINHGLKAWYINE